MEVTFVADGIRGVFGRAPLAALGQATDTIRAVGNARALPYCFGLLRGVILGPFVGIWMSLVAVKYIETGIAATLNSISPIKVIHDFLV